MPIRSAFIDELDLLSELARRSKASWGYPTAFLDACRDELNVAQGSVDDTFVKTVEGRVVGFASLHRLSDERVELEHLFIEPHAFGQGHGRDLLRHVCTRAARSGFRVMVVQSDPGAAGFYLAMGAVMVGERASDSIPDRMLPLFELALDGQVTALADK